MASTLWWFDARHPDPGTRHEFGHSRKVGPEGGRRACQVTGDDSIAIIQHVKDWQSWPMPPVILNLFLRETR